MLGQDRVDACRSVERGQAAIRSIGVLAHALPGARDVPGIEKSEACAPLGISREIVVDEAPRADAADDAEGAHVIRVGDRRGNGERPAA